MNFQASSSRARRVSAFASAEYPLVRGTVTEARLTQVRLLLDADAFVVVKVDERLGGVEPFVFTGKKTGEGAGEGVTDKTRRGMTS